MRARQANQNEEIDILTYLTSGTLDSWKRQTVARKHSFIQQFVQGDTRSRTMEDEDTILVDIPEASLVRMDDYGRNPESKSGEHFRANVWSRRPIHDLICRLCSDLLDEDTLQQLSYTRRGRKLRITPPGGRGGTAPGWSAEPNHS